jgi:hypothetical protein
MTSREEQAKRAAVEAKLLAEADLVVSRLQAALAAAPADDELRAQLECIVEQARHLRRRVQEAITRAHSERGENSLP